LFQIVAIGVVDTGSKFATTQAVLVGKLKFAVLFATRVADTGRKFAAIVVDTGGAP
jgi:hypothetical protein